MKVNIRKAAADETEVFFVLSPEAANASTLFVEVGIFYRAKFTLTSHAAGEQGHPAFISYPYASTDGGKLWSQVGRPQFNHNKIKCFTTMQEAIESASSLSSPVKTK